MNEFSYIIEYKYMGGKNGNKVSLHKHSNRTFPFCVAVSVDEGSYFVEIANKRYDIKKGETVFIPSFVMHNVGTESIATVTYSHFLCSYLDVDVLTFANTECMIFKNDNIRNLLTEINAASTADALLAKIGTDKAIAELIYTLIREFGLDFEYFKMDLWFLKVLNYIHLNLKKDISVDELIRLSGYSKTRFYQLFTQIMNMTPLQYIEQKRIKKATLLLLEGKKVNEVSSEIGFSDKAYFTKKFKKIFGITPSEYKTNYNKNMEEYFNDTQQSK